MVAATYKTIVKRFPLAQAYNNLELDYFPLKEFCLAVKARGDARGVKCGKVGARLFLDPSEYKSGSFKEAAQDLRINRLASPLPAQLYVKEHAAGNALPIFRSLLRDHPEDACACSALGEAPAHLDQNEASANSLRKALQLGSSTNDSRFETAMIYRDFGQVYLAWEQLEISLKHSKKNFQLSYRREQ